MSHAGSKVTVIDSAPANSATQSVIRSSATQSLISHSLTLCSCLSRCAHSPSNRTSFRKFSLHNATLVSKAHCAGCVLLVLVRMCRLTHFLTATSSTSSFFGSTTKHCTRAGCYPVGLFKDAKGKVLVLRLTTIAAHDRACPVPLVARRQPGAATHSWSHSLMQPLTHAATHSRSHSLMQPLMHSINVYSWCVVNVCVQSVYQIEQYQNICLATV